MLEIGPGNESIRSINIDTVYGDKTGYIHMKDDQVAYTEYSDTSILRSSMPVNFHIDEGAQIWMSSEVNIVGSQIPAFKVFVYIDWWTAAGFISIRNRSITNIILSKMFYNRPS